VSLKPNSYQSSNRFVTEREAMATRTIAARRRGDLSIIDPVLDARWARLHSDSKAPKQYYDYFYAGEDMKVYVAEIEDQDPEFGDLPIHNLAFNVQQEKQPLYGFWSYTYDGVMRGTRIVSGSFTLITKHPNYMKNLLTKAANNRSANHGRLQDDYPAPGAWRRDDENIDRYWGKHLDASAVAQSGSEWSVHPPFSLVVVHGVQDTSVELKDHNSRYDVYGNDQALMSDHNQRLVESFDPNDPSRIILDGCELVSVSRAYQTNMMVTEQYQFFARDIFVPTRRTGQQVNVGTRYNPNLFR